MIIKSHQPTNGETKIVKKFAWFPERVNDEEIIWWQHYWVKYQYVENYYFVRGVPGWYYVQAYKTDPDKKP